MEVSEERKNLEEALNIKGIKYFDPDIEIGKDKDDYWHRRWAGDALKGLCVTIDGSYRTGPCNAVTIERAIALADQMERAYKEREENGKDS